MMGKRPMTGLFASLSEKQQQAALAYRGDETFGPPDFKIGMDIRAARKGAGKSQQEIADLFGWNRDAVSKIETGKVSVSLRSYLVIMRFCAPPESDHPGVALAEKLL